MTNRSHNKNNEKTELGVILTGATTSETYFQPFVEAERGPIREGMLVIVEMSKPQANILTRISEIIPHNAFFGEGDGFSEARRRHMPVPSDVARQYETCKLELLMRLPRQEGYEITIPPHPGDRVLKYDAAGNEEAIFGKKHGDDGILWYGSLSGYLRSPIALDIEKIPMHMAIFGVTGSGKSFDTGSLIIKLSEIPAKNTSGGASKCSYPMVIIDANGDYTNFTEYELGAYENITRYVFPKVFKALRRSGSLTDTIKPIGISLNDLNSRELAEAIVQFYRGGSLEGAEFQVSALQNTLEDKVGAGLTHQLLLTTSFKDLRSSVTGQAQVVAAVERALDKFHNVIEEQQELLSERDSPVTNKQAFIDMLTRRGGIAIFDFSADGATGVDLQTKQFFIGYLTTILFDEFTRFKIQGAERYMMFVIEEAQYFCPDKSYPVGSSVAKTKLSAIATQGRKFGLSLCLISQRPSFVDPIVLSMCNTFFIHRISPEDVRFVNSVTGGLPPSVSNRLTRLEQGEMIVTGQISLVPFPLLIRGPDKKERIDRKERVVEHKAGETAVLKGISRLRGD